MIVYFSATGNSRYIAEALADRLGDGTVSANELIKRGENGSFSSESPWIFVFPIYINTMATVFEDFLCASSFSGSRKAYFVATCASEPGTASNACFNVCNKQGFEFMGAEKVVMPQNLIVFFKPTPPEEIKRRIADSSAAVAMIATAVSCGARLPAALASPSRHKMSMAITKLYNERFINTKKFTANGCVGCGVCEKVCPLGNIKLVDGKPHWDDKCVHCMACINNCPKKVIEYGKKSVGKERYVCVKYK